MVSLLAEISSSSPLYYTPMQSFEIYKDLREYGRAWYSDPYKIDLSAVKAMFLIASAPIEGFDIQGDFENIVVYRNSGTDFRDVTVVTYKNTESRDSDWTWYSKYASIKQIKEGHERGTIYGYYPYMYLLYVADDADLCDKDEWIEKLKEEQRCCFVTC